jgi:hypothetical protein
VTATRARAYAWVVVALLLAGCQAYLPSSAPLSPSAEVVRIAFARPRAVALARDERAAADRVDTIADVTAVYGRVVELRGDTLRMAVTQLARRGALQYTPSGPQAAIEISTIAGVERSGLSHRRTTVLASIVVGAAVATGLFLAAFAAALGGSSS